ncbi:acyltransferase [Kitasatospora sp. NPDC049258]|uniref:acyltransferase family protein n=1 Tax=Kitasatospora sp. NPDC049258 TaxID=3155394 RepID=UPI00343DFFCF
MPAPTEPRGPVGFDAFRRLPPPQDETMQLRVLRPGEAERGGSEDASVAASVAAFEAAFAAKDAVAPAAGPELVADPEAGPDLEAEPAAEAPVRRKSGRDRYLDLLRALALVRVILYHNFSWGWLPLAFPSMGVMFALAGSLMVRSLSRPALSVIRGRLRRLLPPMWLFGAVLTGFMLLDGWGPNSEGHPGWWWGHLAFWVLPLSNPPYGADLSGFHGMLEHSWAENVAVPLWYLRAYLWYVLLSPLMLRCLRKQPLLTVLAPLALSWLINSGLFSHDGRIGEAATDFTTFGACWLLGMAHQEGILRRMPQYLAPSLAPLIMVAGLWWLLSRPIEDPTLIGDLESVPFAQAIWSFGYVLLLLHLSPSWETWPRPLERWDGWITLLNARAVSVYLWHVPALTLAVPIMDNLWNIDFLFDHGQWLLRSHWTPLLIALPLLAGLVLCFGWMEDLAAKRSLRLFPYPRRSRGRRRAA